MVESVTGLMRRALAAPQAQLLCALALLGALTPAEVHALPSFARQTGMPCSQCHPQSFGPALTAYGRQFKLNGYTFGEGESPMPLAGMVQGGYTRLAKDTPEPLASHFSTNDNLAVDQVSGFFGSRLSAHSGAFVQVTYSGEDRHTSWDNLDVRYARTVQLAGTDAVIGISVNNNPTVQDLWNSTPAWGFPYISSGLVPGSAAATLVEGGLAQTVLGATAYAMLHDHVYLEAGGYRGLSDHWLSNIGLTADASPHVNGLAPYWRAAYQGGSDPYYFSVGGFGLQAKLQPDPTVAATDRFTDVALDATFQYANEGRAAFTVNAALIHERQSLNASFAAGATGADSIHLTSLHLDATYTYQQTWSLGAGFFDVSGARDTTLYGPNPLDGSLSGSPDTQGYTLQLEYIPFGKSASWGRPWVNVRLGLQYTGYTKFNGGGANYDGFGRAAGDNNSLFLFYWIAF